MRKRIHKLSARMFEIWRRVCERRKWNSVFQQMEKELGSLNPGTNVKTLLREYYIEKIHMGFMVVGLCGVVLAFCMGSTKINGDLEEGKYIKKEDALGGKKEVLLQAKIGKMQIKDLLIEVEERELSDDEVKKYLETIGEQLPEMILGENESLQDVKEPLSLINAWEDTEIFIVWSSSDNEVLQEDGALLWEKIPKEGMDIILTAVLSCGNNQVEKVIPVTVYPQEKTREEQIKEELLNLIRIQAESTKQEEFIVLPERLSNVPILWEEEKGSTIIAPACLMAAMFIGIMWGKDHDVHKQYEIRNRQLLLEYSEFVSKLQLLISSGVSMRSAFIRLAKDYTKRREQGGGKKYVYEELLVAVRKMENGMNEIDVYHYFAKRCDLICYKKLAAIITQNVKRGTEGLKESLYAEVRNAFEVRKQEARKLGEEAGTKLLFPMIMMMGVVLMIIVVPAYFSFGGI